MPPAAARHAGGRRQSFEESTDSCRERERRHINNKSDEKVKPLEGSAVKSVLGLGLIDLALGILLMAPLSMAVRRHEHLSTAFFLLFQVCSVVGMVLVAVAGLLAVAA